MGTKEKEKKVFLSTSIQEKIYQEELYVIEKADISNRYVKGRIVGFIDENTYKVILADTRIGGIKCSILNAWYTEKDGIFIENEDIKDKDSEKMFLKYIGKEYYFELLKITSDGVCILGIKSPMRDYLKYIVDHGCIVRGYILQIDSEYAYINIIYGLVFRIKAKYVFGYQFDREFCCEDYVGAEVSVTVCFDKIKNRFYLYIAVPDIVFNIYKMSFVFPVLSAWNNSLYSKLWLDRKLQLNDKKNYPIKYIGQLQIVSNIRSKGFKSYKANVRGLVEKDKVQKYKKYMLACGWIVDLKHQEIDEVINYLKDRNFLYQIHYKYSNEPENMVIGMLPNIDKETLVPKNMIISLIVSMGQEEKKTKVPNVVGMSVKDAQKVLNENHINFHSKKSKTYVADLGDNCIIKIKPKEETYISKHQEVILYINQKTIKPPFALWENEILGGDAKGKVVGKEKNLEQFYNDEKKGILLNFILKHSIVTSKQIFQWMNLNCTENVTEYEIEDLLKYLINISMVGSVNVRTEFLESNFRFYFPRINLYEKYRGAISNRLYWQQRDVRYFKTRGAENQAFLKLYSILYKDNNIKYEVDYIQSYLYEETLEYIKLHFAVKVIHKESNKCDVYYIEAIRFINDEQLLDAWDKVIRYSHLIDKEYPIKPILMLVFEDKEYYNRFFDKKPMSFYLKNITIQCTWDELTNLDNGTYEEIFNKGEVSWIIN